MSVVAPRGVGTRACKKLRTLDVQADVVIPFDVIVTHVLRQENLPDPADLAVLRGVSRTMRDAVDATGRHIDELDEIDAACRGYLTTLRCRQRRGHLSREERLCQAAARSGQFEELQDLRAENCPWDEHTCAGAAEGGHLEVLQWARESGCSWDKRICEDAAKGGHLEELKWARENGCPWDNTTCVSAADFLHWELLTWAYMNGCPWDNDPCNWAVKIRHQRRGEIERRATRLEALKWARENECPWCERTCAGAAEGGHLNLLKYARENGCP